LLLGEGKIDEEEGAGRKGEGGVGGPRERGARNSTYRDTRKAQNTNGSRVRGRRIDGEIAIAREGGILDWDLQGGPSDLERKENHHVRRRRGRGLGRQV